MAKKKPVPEWAKEPFRRFAEYSHQELDLVRLATAGITQLSRGEPLAEALANAAHLFGDVPEDAAQRLESARELARLAQGERESEFTRLHGHSLVGIWGALESLVEDVAVAWLTHRPSLLKVGELAGVRISVAEFQRLTREARLRLLVNEGSKRTGVSAGFPRLEETLGRVGLAGGVEETLRRSLIEFYSLRNVFAHRMGLVDRKLKTECPWRQDWRVGERVILGSAEYRRLLDAVMQYVAEIAARTGDKFGLNIRVDTAAEDVST